MAVKPITNKQLVDKQSINRAEQVSFGGEQVRGGNSAKSINPGINYTNNYAVTLKDVDTSIIKHIKDVMRLKIENNGETKDVPILYANQERWVNARKNNFLKENNFNFIIIDIWTNKFNY